MELGGSHEFRKRWPYPREYVQCSDREHLIDLGLADGPEIFEVRGSTPALLGTMCIFVGGVKRDASCTLIQQRAFVSSKNNFIAFPPSW